jgi:hypothetical protein
VPAGAFAAVVPLFPAGAFFALTAFFPPGGAFVPPGGAFLPPGEVFVPAALFSAGALFAADAFLPAPAFFPGSALVAAGAVAPPFPARAAASALGSFGSPRENRLDRPSVPALAPAPARFAGGKYLRTTYCCPTVHRFVVIQ